MSTRTLQFKEFKTFSCQNFKLFTIFEWQGHTFSWSESQIKWYVFKRPHDNQHNDISEIKKMQICVSWMNFWICQIHCSNPQIIFPASFAKWEQDQPLSTFLILVWQTKKMAILDPTKMPHKVMLLLKVEPDARIQMEIIFEEIGSLSGALVSGWNPATVTAKLEADARVPRHEMALDLADQENTRTKAY